ncbi:MAG: hypothetical protein JSR17_11730 [Proteobacteria bacterium]|nr:hypothetical protein [Pseudomonadota bacterium]
MIKKGIFIFTLLSLQLTNQVIANQPLLLDVKVVGGAQSPLFEPQNFTLDAGQDYLLVITNSNNDSITFDFGNFGQQVFTRSINGTSSVTQQSLVINGNSKVQWHFSPQNKGEYTYYAINTGLNARGVPGKIVVNKLEEKSSITQNNDQENGIAPEKLTEKASAKKRNF